MESGITRLGLVAALLLAAGGCGYGGSQQSCDLRFPPQEAPQVENGNIIGRIYGICDKAPEQHHLEWWLEKRNTNGAFTQISDKRSSERIPGKRRTNYDAVVTPCVAGVWRVAAHAIGSLDGVPFDFSTNSGHLAVAASDC